MYRLLIAEDETKLREALGEYFIRLGYDVDLAADGLDAINRISENKYDLVILDIMKKKNKKLNMQKCFLIIE